MLNLVVRKLLGFKRLRYDNKELSSAWNVRYLKTIARAGPNGH
jgi:hypothetical protein